MNGVISGKLENIENLIVVVIEEIFAELTHR